MRPVTLPPRPLSDDINQQIAWLGACVNTLAQASQEDPAAIFDDYSTDVSVTAATRALNDSAPTTQNLAAVLASLIADWQARGTKRTQPT